MYVFMHDYGLHALNRTAVAALVIYTCPHAGLWSSYADQGGTMHVSMQDYRYGMYALDRARQPQYDA